jgi:hypothetical protein
MACAAIGLGEVPRQDTLLLLSDVVIQVYPASFTN